MASRSKSVSRKPRVMLFTDSFIHGGTERQFVQVLRQLDRQKYHLFVGCLKRRGPFLAEVEAMGIPIVEFPITSLRRWSTLHWLRKLAGFLRREKVDLVHAFEFYSVVFAVATARLAGVPVVLASRRELAGDRTFWQQCPIRVACQLSTGIVANSRAAGTCRIGLLPGQSKKVALVPNSIDLEEFHPAVSADQVRNQLGVADNTPLVGSLAPLRPEKDLATFLRAAAAVSAVAPEARFLLIGDGSERQKLESLAEDLGLSGRVLFLGDRNDVPDLLAALDVCVLSSLTESFPNAVLEAMAMGRAVVATNVGGIPELVEEGTTGYLVPPGDADAMARRILELLRDPAQRRAMGGAGRARVEREFTPARMKQKLEGLYDRLLRERRPAARILQISNYPPPVCGWSLRTQLIERELAERGADSRVMDIGPSRRIPGRGCIPVYNSLDYMAKLITYRLRGFTFQPHVNGDSRKGYVLALAAVLLGRLTGKPAVLTFHAGPKQLYFPRRSGFWFHAFRLLFHASGKIICNHEPVKQAIVGYGIPVEQVYPISAFSVQYTEQIPVPLPPAVDRFFQTHQPRLFSYALFRPEFTMECLFEAFAALRREYPRAGLLIVGPQDVPAEAQAEMRRLGIEESALFAGNLPHAEFLTAMQRSDLFVRTHLRDGVCTSVLEALTLGVPVVAAEDGHRPASVITYAPGGAADLKRVLEHVLDDLASARAHVQPPEVPNTLETEILLLLAAGSEAQG